MDLPDDAQGPEPAEPRPAPEPAPGRRRSPGRIARRIAVAFVALAAALTAASFGYNLSTDVPPGRPAGLRMLRAGGFSTRYRTWGTTGSPIVLVPGAFETAGTFAALGAVLGADHRVYAIDLTGTGYSAPSPPFDASHLAAQLAAFLTAEKLTGPNAAVIVGHSSGAAVAGLAALRAGPGVAGVVFLDGDATPLPFPSLAGWLLINPFRTTILRLALSSGWLIRRIYASQCGPACAPPDRGRRATLAAAAGTARLRSGRRLHSAARHPEPDERPVPRAASRPAAEGSHLRGE